MTIKIITALDNYQTNCFPENLTQVPRIGECVRVVNAFYTHFKQKRLPIELIVKNVIWTENGALVEVWYRNIDVEAAKLNNINLF